MNSSKIELKRARPALGTVLLMRLEAPADSNLVLIDEILAQTFELAEELEDKFSKFREGSDVSRVNQVSLGREIPVSREFVGLAKLALEVWKISDGAFNPFSGADLARDVLPLTLIDEGYVTKNVALELDLSGIAKGFVVDRLVAFLTAKLPELSGVINAGGDLRFFNTETRQADIRVGGAAPLARRMDLSRDSVATSAMNESLENPSSTTVYKAPPRAGLGEHHSVSVVADLCATADALTKIGWFADEELIERCASHFAAQVLVFNPHGELHQRFGAP